MSTVYIYSFIHKIFKLKPKYENAVICVLYRVERSWKTSLLKTVSSNHPLSYSKLFLHTLWTASTSNIEAKILGARFQPVYSYSQTVILSWMRCEIMSVRLVEPKIPAFAFDIVIGTLVDKNFFSYYLVYENHHF